VRVTGVTLCHVPPARTCQRPDVLYQRCHYHHNTERQRHFSVIQFNNNNNNNNNVIIVTLEL